EEEYRKALEVREKLAAAFPRVPAYRKQLAGTYNSRAISLYHRALSGTDAKVRASQLAEACNAFRRAGDLEKKLVAEFPGTPEFRLDLGASQCNLGHALRDSGQFQPALESYGQAVHLLTEVMAEDQRLAKARQFLIFAHEVRA